MSLQRTTAPTVPAVTLAEAKAHLRVDIADEDTLIEAWVRSATGLAEQATGRAIMPQVWRLSLDAFPCVIALARVPVRSITSITYVDAAGVTQTLDPSAYTLDNSDDYGHAHIHPAYGTSWPAARCQPNAVQVTFAAGYADAASVPEEIKDWIKLTVTSMHKNRASEAEVHTYALGFADRLLDRSKIWSL